MLGELDRRYIDKKYYFPTGTKVSGDGVPRSYGEGCPGRCGWRWKCSSWEALYLEFAILINCHQKGQILDSIISRFIGFSYLYPWCIRFYRRLMFSLTLVKRQNLFCCQYIILGYGFSFQTSFRYCTCDCVRAPYETWNNQTNLYLLGSILIYGACWH